MIGDDDDDDGGGGGGDDDDGDIRNNRPVQNLKASEKEAEQHQHSGKFRSNIRLLTHEAQGLGRPRRGGGATRGEGIGPIVPHSFFALQVAPAGKSLL